ncbi:MAG: hypothetical protein RJQ34_05345, partial [Balneola sp.]
QELKVKFERLEQNPNSLKSRMKEILTIIESHLILEYNTFEIQMDEIHRSSVRMLLSDPFIFLVY